MRSSRGWMERMALRLIPAVLIVFLLFFSLVIGHIPGMSHIMPLFVIISIYYWCIFYPSTLPYWFLFLLGLVEDSLSGTPLGFSSFIYVLFAIVIIKKYRVFSSMSFAVVWMRFVALCLAVSLLSWLMAALFLDRLISMHILILQWISSCLAYPLIHSMFTHIYRAAHE